MGQLHDMRVKIDQHVQAKGLELFKVRGLISLQSGLMLAMINAKTPDDPKEIDKLKKAVKNVLKIDL